MKRLLTTLSLMLAVLIGSTGVSYALPECPGSPTSSISTIRSWTDCFGILRISSGEANGLEYVGEYKNGKPHGQGTASLGAPHKLAGKKYVGEYKDGKLHGQGTQTHPNGDKCVCEYKDGKLYGQGTYTWANGDKHVGEWKNGKQNGQGTFTLTNGIVKEGIWKKGKFLYAKKAISTRTINSPCPGTYKPTWNNCIGTRTYPDKAVYKGPWKSGKEHGKGTLTYADGEKYVGGFKNGLHHGKGIITSANGKVLKGTWENDKFKSERK